MNTNMLLILMYCMSQDVIIDFSLPRAGILVKSNEKRIQSIFSRVGLSFKHILLAASASSHAPQLFRFQSFFLVAKLVA